jgi:hypothetical protein
MAHNLFHGYVKLPGKPLYYHDIRLDFNPHLVSEPGATRREGFSLRMFTLPEKIRTGKHRQEQPEISVTLSAEQWLDLIAQMQEEFDSSEKWRKRFEDLDKET